MIDFTALLEYNGKSMTKKTRNILFLACLILFFLIAPGAVFYSQGYRIDFNPPEGGVKVAQTGALYSKIQPKSVQIYLNGKLTKKTDFLFGSAFLENLLPKEYNIEIKKQGFSSWKKTLEIKEKEVTEVKNIVLIPESPNFEILAKEVENFFFLPDGKKIILKENSEEGWALKILELKKNVKSHLIGEKEISIKGADLLGLKPFPDSRRILLEIGLKEDVKYYILEIDKTPAVITSLYFLSDIENLSFHPKDQEKLFALQNGELREVNLAKKEITSPLLRDIITFIISNDNIYYLDKSGFILKTDFSFSHKEKINETPFPLAVELPHQIDFFSPYFFLREEETLYFIKEDQKSFTKLSSLVKNFSVSPDGKKIVYFNNLEIWLFFLKDELGQPQKKAGDQLFLTRFSEEIKDCFWYTAHYLMFDTGEKIKIAEIDDRDKLNIVNLANFKKPKLFWNWSDKKLYLQTEKNLLSSKKLLP